MGEKKQDQARRNRSPGRQKMWEAMRRLGGFSVRELRGELPTTDPRTLRSYLGGLVAGGYLDRQQTIEGARYRLVRDAGMEAPRVRKDGTKPQLGAGREAMWLSMRVLKRFSVMELLAVASTEEHPIAPAEAADYCQRLCSAGFLVRARASMDSRLSGYQLVWSRVTGPLPPKVLRDKTILDPNTGRRYSSKGVLHG